MDTATLLLHAALGALAGAALGTAFFRALAVTARLYVAGGARRALALHAVRLGGAVAAFTLVAAAAGAAALVGMLAGFQAARSVALRRVRRAP